MLETWVGKFGRALGLPDNAYMPIEAQATRTILQAGAIPYRFKGDELQFLLLTSKSGRWIAPKGKIDPGHTPQQTAAIETFEEAGVIGNVTGDRLGVWQYTKSHAIHHVTFYPLLAERTLTHWGEAHYRSRVWLPALEAAQTVEITQISEMMHTLADQLHTGALA